MLGEILRGLFVILTAEVLDSLAESAKKPTSDSAVSSPETAPALNTDSKT